MALFPSNANLHTLFAVVVSAGAASVTRDSISRAPLFYLPTFHHVEVAIPTGTLGTDRRTVLLEPERPGVESFTWQDVQAPAN